MPLIHDNETQIVLINQTVCRLHLTILLGNAKVVGYLSALNKILKWLTPTRPLGLRSVSALSSIPKNAFEVPSRVDTKSVEARPKTKQSALEDDGGNEKAEYGTIKNRPLGGASIIDTRAQSVV